MTWLTYSSIGSVWNYVFTLSNASLFVLLPFCYFFIESQGFSSKWHRSVAKSRNYWAKPCVMQRIYETLAVCALLIVVLLCLAEVVIKLLRYDVSILSITSLNLPLIYSGVSFCGALLLLISTPYGFSRMFSFIRKLMSDSEKSAFSPVSEADTMTSPPADDVTEVQDTIERVEEVMSEIQESLAADEQNNIRETNHWRNENYGKKRVASSNCGDFYLSIFNKPTPPTRTYDEWKRSRLAAMSLKNRRRPFLPVNGDGQLRQREVVESPLRVDDNAFGDILVMKPLKHHASEFCLNSPNTFATGDIATNDIFATSYVSASTIGSPIFTSTPIVNLPFFGKRVKKLSGQFFGFRAL
ncbi:unnamed protein product [Caenorhabditis auriculariae]|uniref:Uncharacterized protein n=1 Tax=Caenorhabditis auriculariae TaxID=2777116 RepID=A0A8S1GSB4_9PELO|nr:unnamed protein product [Caenorhabditis auriculariae]